MIEYSMLNYWTFPCMRIFMSVYLRMVCDFMECADVCIDLWIIFKLFMTLH